jgi:hypothetical protein
MPRIKGETAAVETHGWLLSILIKDSKFQPDRQVLLYPHAKIGLSQWGQEKMEGTHFAAVVGSSAYGVVGDRG